MIIKIRNTTLCKIPSTKKQKLLKLLVATFADRIILKLLQVKWLHKNAAGTSGLAGNVVQFDHDAGGTYFIVCVKCDSSQLLDVGEILDYNGGIDSDGHNGHFGLQYFLGVLLDDFKRGGVDSPQN